MYEYTLTAELPPKPTHFANVYMHMFIPIYMHTVYSVYCTHQ